MKKINMYGLNEILEKHKMWLKGEKGGERADLREANLDNADLTGADLRNTDLRYAILKSADLKETDLRKADLRYADLSGADLRNTDLRKADLRKADLRNANLRYADLSGVDLRNTDLSGADLRNANLRSTDLSGADLSGIKTNMNTIGYNLACPEEGSFIGYKKANKCIIKLLILEDSKRSSATTAKCRCNKAKVLDITDINTGEKVEEAYSDYDSKFIYKVGKIVSVDNFNNNRWNECSTGIHFFMNKDNAINY